MGSTRRAARPRTLGLCLGVLLALVPLTASAQDGLSGGPPQSDYAAGLSYAAGAGGGAPVAPVAAASSPDVQTKYADGIVIKGSKEFVKKATDQLDVLKTLPTGKKIIEGIGKTGQTTTITEVSIPNGWASWDDPGAATPDAKGNPGAGSDSTVGWNPNYSPGDFPSTVILAHELIHAKHIGEGVLDLDPFKDPKDPTNVDNGIIVEELKTVGIPPHTKSNPLTENAVRDDWNKKNKTAIPVRESYAPGGWSPTGLYTPKEAEAERLRLEALKAKEKAKGKGHTGEAMKGAAGVLNDLFGGSR